MATVHLRTVCAMSMNAKHETRPLQNVTRGPLFVKASLPINLMQQLGHMQYVAAQLHLMYRSIQEHKHHIPTNLSQPSTTAHLEHSTGINKYNLIVKVRFCQACLFLYCYLILTEIVISYELNSQESIPKPRHYSWNKVRLQYVGPSETEVHQSEQGDDSKHVQIQ